MRLVIARIGIPTMNTLHFGGSFNPIHHGHLICARAVAEAGGFGRVVLVPSAQPPHKPAGFDLAAAADRAEMCRLAVASDPLFEVDEIELNRSGPSYTIDTVRELKQRDGIERIHWLIGADMLAILPKWHQAEALLNEARLVVMARPGWSFDWDALPHHFRHLQSQVVEAPLIDISATALRARVRNRQSIAYFIPQSVVEYIARRGLYR